MNFEITEKHIQLLADTNINWYLHKKLSSMKVKFTYKSFCELIIKPSTLVRFLYTDIAHILAVEYLINGYTNVDDTVLKIYNIKNKKIFHIILPLPYEKINIKLRFLNNRFLSMIYIDNEPLSYKQNKNKIQVFGKDGCTRTYCMGKGNSLKTKILKYDNFYIGYDIADRIDYIEFYDSDFNCIVMGDYFLNELPLVSVDELKNEIVIISTDENKTVVKFKNNKELLDITFHKKYTKVCGIYTNYFVKGYDNNYRIEFYQQYDDSYIMYHAPYNHYNTFLYKE